VPSFLAPDRGIDGSLRDAVLDAVAQTVLEHPLLQVGQVGEDSNHPAWVQLESIDLNQHIVWVVVGALDDYDARLRAVTHEQLDARFTDLETRPAWTIRVLARDVDLASIDVVFNWHHANCDGVSGKIFHESLLRNLNSADEEDDGSPRPEFISPGVMRLPTLTSSQLIPPVENLGKFSLSTRFAVAVMWQYSKPNFMRKTDITLVRWSPIREKPYGTEFRTAYLDDVALQSVLAACRQHQTTLTGLLNALALASLSLQFQKGETWTDETVRTMSSITAMDFRRFMPSRPPAHPWLVPSESMANIMTMATHDFQAGLIEDIRRRAQGAKTGAEIMAKIAEVVWSVAARCREDIQRKLDCKLENDYVSLGKFVGDWRAQMRQQAAKPRSGTFTVSNLGVMDGVAAGAAGGWSIERAGFHLSADVASPVFHISALSVKGKDLCVDISWQRCVADKAVGERLLADTMEWLRYLAQAPQSA
jgi:hypothetical protein